MARAWNVWQQRGLFTLAVMPLILTLGCAQIPLSNPTPSFEIIEKAKASRTAPVALGLFKVDPKVNADIDKGLNVRTNTIASPFENSFAQYLKQTLQTDLQASGLYDAAAPITLNGYLTESVLDVPTDTGRANLGARFVLVRTGVTIFEKELKANANWPSSFLGPIAIPAAINHYTSLFHKLVGQLLDDPDFQRANSK